MLNTVYGSLADALVFLHLGFIVFVVAGGVAAWRWPRIAWFHVPAALWAALVEIAGWYCPLTPWEKELRALAGESAYSADFVSHYILPVLYPAGLTREMQIGLGAAVLVGNGLVYWVARRRWTRRRGLPREAG